MPFCETPLQPGQFSSPKSDMCTSTDKIIPSEKNRLNDLPEELIERICQLINLNSTTDKADEDTSCRNALLDLCLTSKVLKRITQVHLYHDIQLKKGIEMICLMRSIHENPALADLVRSASLHIDWSEMIDIDYDRLVEYASFTHDSEQLRRLRLAIDFPSRDTCGLLLVENHLLKLNRVTQLTLSWNTAPEIDLLSQVRLRSRVGPLLPCLRALELRVKDGYGNFAHINTILGSCKLEKLTVAGIHTTQINGIETGQCTTLKEFTLVNSPWLSFRNLSPLIKPFPNLERFHFCTLEPEELNAEADDYGDMITAKDIVRGLESVRTTLKTLSICTESLGDDDGFPSLKRFEVLENLHVDAFDLAEYEEDDEEESDTDTDDDDGPPTPGTSTNAGAISLDDIPDDDGDEDFVSVTESDTDTETEASEDDDESTSSSGTDTCKAILHLLPTTLKTLWIDNLDDLDGGLNEELVKLAKSYKEQFPNFHRLTIQTHHQQSEKPYYLSKYDRENHREGFDKVEIVRKAYEKAGLGFRTSKRGWAEVHGIELGGDPNIDAEDEDDQEYEDDAD